MADGAQGTGSKARTLELTTQDRKNCTILVVEPDANIRHSMRQSILSLGFPNVYDASDHAIALRRLEERRFTHIVFDAKNSVIPARDFMRSAQELEKNAIYIPTSYDPSVDDVFSLLTFGARGYIVKPFTSEAIDQVFTVATKGEPLCPAILHTSDRNEALAALVMHALDKLATARRQAKRFATAKHEIPLREQALKRAVELGKTFARGGAYGFFEAVVKHSIERGEGKHQSEVHVPKRRPKRSMRNDPKRTLPHSIEKSVGPIIHSG